MVNTPVFRLGGKTFCLDLTSTASDELLITGNNDNINYVSLLNTGSDVASIELRNATGVAEPTIGSNGNLGSYVLPGDMNYPILIACPFAPFYIRGLSSGTNTLYITAIEQD